MTRVALIGAALLIAVGSVGVLAQDETTPTITNPEITVQTVEVGQRAYLVDPYDLFSCEISKRTEEVPQGSDDAPNDKSIIAQCFIRDETGQMVAIDAFPSLDQGVTETISVGGKVISAPQQAQPEERDPLDG